MPTQELIVIFILSACAFLISCVSAPFLIRTLKKLAMGKTIRIASEAPIFSLMHKKKAGIPTMGGILVWGTVLFLALLPHFFDALQSFNFLSRAQTFLPLGALASAAIVGLLDDYLNVRKIGAHGGGIRVRHRLILYTLIACIAALWFFYKLEWDLIRVPFIGNFELGWFYIPTFVGIIVATSFSTNEADGLDGLAGGLLLTAFVAYGGIAFAEGRYDLAALCGVIVGALVGFLWFNVNPAQFFMGDTGAMALGVTLGVIAMLTNYSLLLPIICFPFVIESLSVIMQIASKKFRKGKKIFQSAPLHHHLEAIGWTEPQIVMRFWIIGGMTALIGFILALVDLQIFRG